MQNQTPSTDVSELIYHGKFNGIAAAPIWQEYNWGDIIQNGVQNAAEGTLVAKSDNFVLANGKSGELKIEVLLNEPVDKSFFDNENYKQFLHKNFYNHEEKQTLFVLGNHCLILRLTHGNVSESMVLELPSKDNDTELKQSQSLCLHGFLISGGQETTSYFKGSGIGHVALSFVKQLALRENLGISLLSVDKSGGFYENEQFVVCGQEGGDKETPMKWNI